MTIINGRSIALALLCCAAAALSLLSFFVPGQPPSSVRALEQHTTAELDGMLCDNLTLEEQDQVGTFCIQEQDQILRAALSIDPAVALGHNWKLEVAYLMVETTNVGQEESRVIEYTPNQDQLQDHSVAFEDVSIANDLNFVCPVSNIGSFTAQMVAVFNKNGPQHDLITLNTTVSFSLTCTNGLRDNNKHIVGISRESPTDAKEEEDGPQKSDEAGERHHFRQEATTHQRRAQGELPSTDWMNVPRNDACSATNELIRNPNTILDEAFLRKAYISEYLSGEICYDRNVVRDMGQYQQVYEHFYAWDDGVDDLAVVVKIEDVCYGAFRGTDPFNLNDLVIQNLNPKAAEIDETNCFVREGYYDAYFTNYKDDFESKLNTCIDSCDDGPCQVVFTGGSQGAGPATVASLVYRELAPLVITWGGAKVLYRLSPRDNTFCVAVNPQNHYRMIVTDRTVGLVDLIPFQWAFFADHIGHAILYDATDFNYLGINPRIDRSWMRYSLLVHAPCNYNRQTRLLYENVCFPCASTGWIDGHWCAVDEDCESGLCYFKTCHELFRAEERCQQDEQCYSGVCNANVWRCTTNSGLMGNKMACQEGEDCSSGRCVRRWLPFTGSRCEAQLETGEKCSDDSDCLSGVCGGFLFRKQCWPEDDPEHEGGRRT